MSLRPHEKGYIENASEENILNILQNVSSTSKTYRKVKF